MTEIVKPKYNLALHVLIQSAFLVYLALVLNDAADEDSSSLLSFKSSRCAPLSITLFILTIRLAPTGLYFYRSHLY